MDTLSQISRLPASLLSLVLFIAVVPVASVGTPVSDHSSCGCYLTNGTESQYLSHHQFFDFRSQTEHAGVPPIIDDFNKSGIAPVTSKFFEAVQWKDMFMPMGWNNTHGGREDRAVNMTHSPNNIYIEANNNTNTTPKTWLTLRTQRLATFQSAAELESRDMGFQYISVRMLSRTIGGKGAITALFTYRHSDELAQVQESDIEFRTLDPPTNIRYTNQPAYTAEGETLDQATQNGTMPDGLGWTDWAVHRMDWRPARTTWFVNGKQTGQISFQTPRDPSKINLNAWSDGGQWSGNMSVGDAAYLQIQWLEIVYNSSLPVNSHSHKRGVRIGDEGRGVVRRVEGEMEGEMGLTKNRLAGRAEGVCNAVCSIDETPNPGEPVLLWKNASSGAPRRLIVHAGPAGWVPSVVVVVMLGLSAGWW